MFRLRNAIIFPLILFLVSTLPCCDNNSNTTSPGIKGIIEVPDDFQTIQEAINAASIEGAQIIIDDGIYKGEGNTNLDTLGKHVQITGNVDDPSAVVIDCENKSQGITFSGGENRMTILESITITNAQTIMNGGGISVRGMPIIRNCIIKNNVSNLAGGGIACLQGSKPIFINCLIIGNHSLGTSLFEGGGGIYCDRSEPTFINCSLSRNSASNGGGIFSFYNSTPILINSIVFKNIALDTGNEIVLYNGGTASGMMRLFNCQFSNDTDDVVGSIETENCINSDPEFVDAGNLDYNLKNTSECIDNGSNFYLYSEDYYDLLGFPRIANKIVDIGAIEYSNVDLVPLFSINVREEQQSINVQFTDKSTGDPTEWEWDFDNDGIIDSNAQNPVFSYDFAGLYSVTLTIHKNADASSATFKNIISYVKNEQIIVPDDVEFIQHALDIAGDGTEIILKDGSFSGYWNRNLDFKGKSVHLKSKNGADTTVIDCENAGHGFIFNQCEMTDSIVEGITVINGFTEFDGGGFCIIDSSPTIKNCVVKGNCAGNNGGGFSIAKSNAVIENCEVSENKASSGAGIFIQSAKCSILECIIVENEATSFGGGIYISYLSALIQNSVIRDNNAGNGAGIYLLQASANINNCLLIENEAFLRGGGMFIEGETSLPKAVNLTISDNEAKQGGGVFVADLASPSFKNSIIWSNHADVGFQFYISILGEGAGIVLLTNCDYGATHDDIEDTNNLISANSDTLIINPKFETVGDDEYFLSSTSPCIDAGTGSATEFLFLAGRSITALGDEDLNTVDIGYHYKK